MKKRDLVLGLLLTLAAGCQKIPENGAVPGDQKSGEEPAGVTLYVNVSEGVNLREEPDAQSKKVDTLELFTPLRVLQRGNRRVTIGGQSGTWIRVQTGDGKTGWVFGGFLSETPDYAAGLAGSWWLDNYYFKLRENGTFTFGLYNGGLSGAGDWSVEGQTVAIDGILGDGKNPAAEWKAAVPFEMINAHRLKLRDFPAPGAGEALYTRRTAGYYPRTSP
ncbi:MAG: SH3 domain-containing protein [Treponema sp.]|nr:SH3 domain-containing protein [Treponema sp.]